MAQRRGGVKVECYVDPGRVDFVRVVQRWVNHRCYNNLRLGEGLATLLKGGCT